jgi:Holliday junction resolvasome RuvABC endonuclease subunit
MTCIMGIDPGISGAVAFYFPATPSHVSADDVPVAGDQIAGGVLFDLIKKWQPDIAIIEHVNAMPGQGVSSTFKFGRSFGTVIGVVQASNVQLHFVTPTKWKKHFNLPSDKDRARELALRMFPNSTQHFTRKKDHGRAEAALIALYAAQTIFRSNAA